MLIEGISAEPNPMIYFYLTFSIICLRAGKSSGRGTYLHVANEECEKNQPKGGDNDGEKYFSNVSGCSKILSCRTANSLW
jgi:hypothetical protein